MLNSLLKILFAVSSVFLLSSDQDPQIVQNDKQDIKQTLDYLDKSAAFHSHADGEMCGFDRKLRERMEKDPEYAREVEHYRKVIMPQLIKQQKERESARGYQPPIYTIPLVFHLVHKAAEPVGSGQNLNDQAIFDAVQTLNEDFQALNDGYENVVPDRFKPLRGNAEIHFCLAEFDPQGNPTNGINRIIHEGPYTDAMHDSLKGANKWDTNKYYNIWVVPIISGAAGYAYLPSRGIIGSALDGTVCDNAYVGAGIPVLTHEVGHALGLYHTFQGGCGGDDGIADTPLQGETSRINGFINCSGNGNPMGPNTCGEEHMFVNFMDYTSFACMTTFSADQALVMRGVLSGNIVPLTTGLEWASRAELEQSTATVSPSCSPTQPPGGGGTNPDPDPDPVINDAGIRAIIEPSEPEFCASGVITPVVLLTNDYGEETLTSCDIKYRVSGIPGSTTFNWSGSLETNEQVEVELAPFNSPNESYDITVWTSRPNGGDDDNNFNNEKTTAQTTISAAEPNVIEDFEPTAFGPSDKDITTFNPDNDNIEWERTTAVSAYGLGNACTVINNHSGNAAAGSEDWLITPLFDFTTINNPRLTFDVAALYTPNQSIFDTLEIRVSTDCGETFPNVVWKKGGQDLATVTKGFSPPFTPTAEEWRNEKASLTAFEGTQKLYVAIVNKGYNSNNIYLDNINLAEGCASDVSTDFTDIECGGECTGSISLNLTGFEAPANITWSANAQASGEQSLDGLCEGTYYVTVVDPVYNCEFVEEIEISAPWELTWNPFVTNEVLFPNSNNGGISLAVDGGTFVYTYTWSDGWTPEPNGDGGFRSGLAPGTYCVTVTDTNDCSLEDCFEVGAYGCDLEPFVQITYPDCATGGPIIGEVMFDSSSPFGYTVIWSDGQFLFSTTHLNLIPGFPYEVYVTENTPGPPEDRCESQVNFVVYDPSPPSINPNILHESNAGAMNGAITLNTQGNSDFTYSWDNGETTESIDGLSAGFYTVTITDINTTCTTIETIEILVLDCDIDIDYSFVEPDCFEGNNGSLSVTVTGGNNTTTSWDNAGINGLNPSGLSAGTYTLIVEDDDGCRIVEDVFLPQPGLLDIDFTVSDESVPSAQDGTIDASVTGGTPDFTYVWSNGATTSSINGLGGGTYTVTVTDANGCTTVKGQTVQGVVCPEFDVEGIAAMPNCFEGLTGGITVTTEGPIGPFTYSWSDDNTATSEVRTGLAAGDYEVTITDVDSGCTSTQMFTVDQPEELTLMVSGTNESLMGAADGTATAAGLGGTGTLTYAWDNGETTISISNLAPGEYCVVATDENNCTIEACYTVTGGADPCENTALNVSIDEPGILDCNVNQVDIVALDGGASGTATFVWSDGSTGSVLTVGAAGEYSVIVTDELGCTNEAFVTVIEDIIEPAISLSTTPETLPSAADGMVSVSVSNAQNVTYEWTDVNGMTVGTTAEVSGLAPGTYCVVVTNMDNGCTTENCIEVLAGADPCATTNLGVEVDAQVTILTCLNTSIDLVAVNVGGQGTTTYLWSDGSDDQTLTVTAAGAYMVTVTDELGCTTTASLEVGVDIDEPTIMVSQTEESTQGANDGTAMVSTIDDISNYEINWTDASGNNIGTGSQLTNLAPGEYCVQLISVINGCSTEECITIVGGSDPCSIGIEVVIDLANDISIITCINEVVSLEALIEGGTAPFEYLWNTGSTDASLEVTTGGEYSVIVTDDNGCTTSNIFTVDEITNTPEITVTGSGESTTGASDGSASVVSTETEVTYEWTNSNGMVIGTDANVEALAPGEYCVEVTLTETGCSTVDCFTVLEGGDPCAESPIVIINSLTEPILTCEIASVTLEASGSGGNGALSYLWAPIGEDGATIDATEPGVYTVIVSDENGCTAEASIEVALDQDLPSAEVTATPETTDGALDGTVSVVVDGNTSVEWYDAAGNTISTDATVSGLAPGEYCVVVTNTDNGCETETCVDVLEGDDPCIDFTAFAETTAVLCAGDSNGSADVEVTGGTGPFDVSLNGLPITSFTGNTFTTPAILPSGSTVVQIEDANGCVVDVELEINEPEQIEVVVDATTETAPGAADGTASAVGSGGTGSYTYEWSNGAMTAEIDGLVAGEYCVIITDENDCSTESCVEVSQGADPCENFAVELFTEDIFCNGESTGVAGVEVIGSSGDLLITWSNGMSGSSIEELTPGTYSVQVTDANDCTYSEEFEIVEPDPIMVNVSGTNESALGAEDGTADASVTGGTGTYTYSWSGGNNFSASTEDLEGLGSGTYCLVVTDEFGCESEEFCIEIDAGADPCLDFEASISISDLLCNGDNSGEAVVEIFNGMLPYTYDWSGGNSSTSTNSGLPAGAISVVVSDANGCEVTLEANIEEPTELQVNVANVTAETDTGANDGTLEIEIAGGVLPYELIWDNGATTEGQDGLACGTYFVTVIDGNDCSVETSATVPCQDLGCESLQADIQVDPVSCFGDIDGQIEIFPSGGTGPYEVTLNSGQSGTSINNLPASLYVVIVEDANGCIFTEEVTVQSPMALETQIFGEDGLCGAMAIAQVVPFGGTAPYAIEWSTGSNAGVITNLDSGTYTVTITDANNCITTDLVTVENVFEPIEFDVQIGNVFCNGGVDGFINVEVTEGQTPFTYQWSNGATTPELFDLPAGQYTLVITDGNGCEYALSRDIIEPNALQMDYAVSQGGTSTTFDVTLSVSGGTAPYTYDWSDGSNSIVNTGMQVGSYTVTIVDDRGCEQTFDVIIDGALTGIAGLDIIESFKVYPNPTKDQIFFVAELSEYAKLNISVYNALGQLIFQDKAEGVRIKKDVNLNQQPVGTYFLQVGNDKGQIVEKILKVD